MALIRPDEPGKYMESPYDHPGIWIRRSQKKISYINPQPDQAILEVVGINYLSTPARVGVEMIINLVHNGVGVKVFSKLNQSNMDRIYESLTAWTGYEAMPKLCDWISRRGGVLQMRLNRLPPDPLSSEVNGYTRKQSKSSNQDDEPLEWFPDLVSGMRDLMYASSYGH
jgi:hypothetical protein